jgi:hypothetical protein
VVVASPTPTVDPAQEAEAQAAIDAEKQRQAEVAAVLQAENATVVVQNGTDQPEMATNVAQFLRSQGFNVIQFGPADRMDYPRTVIVDYTTDSPYALEVLATIFNVAEENIRRSPNLKSDVDLRVIVGADFQMPEARALETESQSPSQPAQAAREPESVFEASEPASEEPFIQPTRSQ